MYALIRALPQYEDARLAGEIGYPTRRVQAIGCVVKAPSTLGTFLRSFRWGHVRQLARVSRELLARAWSAGAGTGDVLMSRLREGRANTVRAPPTSCVRR